MFLTTSPRKTWKATFPELRISGGLPNVHPYYLFLAQRLLLAERRDFVLSCPVAICDLEFENLTAAAEL